MNSKLTALAAAIMVAAATGAQTPKRDFKRDIRLSASNLLAYPGPDNSRKMTPAPDSLKPFYISHYGRHGSRFLIDPEDYAEPLATLHRADSMGKLTLRGRDLMRRISWMQAEADGRLGELTEIGARQHRGISIGHLVTMTILALDNSCRDSRNRPAGNSLSRCKALL